MPRLLLGLCILLLVPVFGQAQGDALLLRVGNLPVSKSEFEYFYRKSVNRDKQQFLETFLDYKRKVAYAQEIGLDTLSAFQKQKAYYGRLLQARDSMDLHEAPSRFVEKGEWVKIAHVTRLLPQDASKTLQRAEQQLMDSLRSLPQIKDDFIQVAREYTSPTVGLLAEVEWPWMPAFCFLTEWQKMWEPLKVGEVSPVFQSPLGIHIIQCLGKRLYVSTPQNRTCQPEGPDRFWKQKEMAEGLLAALVSRRFGETKVTYTEKDLSAYFKSHAADYEWELPHYRGAVIHCKDKKEAKAIKKCLKKKSLERWEELFQKMVVTLAPNSSMEFGLFQIGKNAYVDRLVFKCGDELPQEEGRYTFVLGKKLKKGPKSYLDVREKIIEDYVRSHHQNLREKLRARYVVEINEEVLKTVNITSSNEGKCYLRDSYEEVKPSF